MTKELNTYKWIDIEYPFCGKAISRVKFPSG